MNEIIQKLHQLAGSELVDISGGSDSLPVWLSETRQVHFRKNPEVVVLILEKNGEKYNGALYVTSKDFERRV
jgi:hypothetical protein